MVTRTAKLNGKTGKKGLGDILGFAPQIDIRGERLVGYRVRFRRQQADQLAKLLAKPGDNGGFILTATSERFERIRILSSPAPNYELRAAPRHVRGDVVRITGTRRSCNINLSLDGAALVRQRLMDSLSSVREWVEMRARIVRHTPDEGSRCVLEFIPDSEADAMSEHERLARTGTLLAAQSWPIEDFSDWEKTR